MQLSAQPWLQAASTQALLAAFARAGYPLRFVGGCVRDAIMGRAVGDVDCATPATPDQVMALLAAAQIKCVPTGLAHGTVTAIIAHQPFEITTLRRDTACDGRHAEVAFTTDWAEDAQRRDFTMNALYCDAEGHIHDYTQGIADAQSRRVVFIGDAQHRIREDGLRILRFFRFLATHGAPPADDSAIIACTQLRDRLHDLSGERIQQEMRKLLAAPSPLASLQAMFDAGVLGELITLDHLPVAALQRYDALCDALHISPHPWLRLALIAHRAQPSALPIAQRWKLSNADAALLDSLRRHDVLGLPDDSHSLTMQLRRYGRELRQALLLRDAAEQDYPLDAVVVLYNACATQAIPQFPISGADLLALGYAQGAAIGTALKALEDYWEAQHYQPDKAALLARLK